MSDCGAFDARNRSVAVSVVSNVTTAAPGTYAVVYTAVDAFGNTAVAVRRVGGSVVVPTLVLVGPALVEVVQGDVYGDAGVVMANGVLATRGLPVSTATPGNVREICSLALS